MITFSSGNLMSCQTFHCSGDPCGKEPLVDGTVLLSKAPYLLMFLRRGRLPIYVLSMCDVLRFIACSMFFTDIPPMLLKQQVQLGVVGVVWRGLLPSERSDVRPLLLA